MSNPKSDRTSDFQLEGRFLGFAAEPGSYKLKYIRLATATGEQHIKLPKELRTSLYRSLTPGEWIQVMGVEKQNSEQDRVKLKAYQVLTIEPATAQRQGSAQQQGSAQLAIASPPPPVTSAKSVTPAKSACILICQKSDCCKRGSRAVANALQAELSDRGLADQVTVKATGCMKRCKEGANVIMPDKSRHTQVRPGEVATLIDQHVPALKSAALKG
ncbi:MAG: (2Fe-2S) ferredoxin domain-containing protein [Leptolyngbyaceae cyanobacterium CRU_2_3]|nr:(2Fe-2S) ferredoxin domain-containing protein [Leptolyngbyaceae cyanobacterium CRU_2_3]